MPRSAIATGLVDYELPPAEMVAQLITYFTYTYGNPSRLANTPISKSESNLKKIFVLLRAHTRHDFSQYKPSTVLRRIERRMAVNQIKTMDGYVKFLQQTPTEPEALFRDLLIGVTNFFRDPDAFKALEEQVIPRLFSSQSNHTTIRVWVPGCSTGEEAYSIAMLLAERQEALKRTFAIQVFATDIDNQSIATARTGLYPANIAADISPERLARFFSVESDGSSYRIHKTIRDMLVFSEQDVIKDPPFSKLDLISCRNLLIYMSAELQKKLIPLFHYALNPGGFLFLGNSESVGEYNDLFSTLDRKLKLYQRKDDIHSMRSRFLGNFLPPLSQPETSVPLTAAKAVDPGKMPLRVLTEQTLLQLITPAAALINEQGDILYLHGRTGLYLELTPGEASVNNILKMAREGLRRDLSTALHKAVAGQETVYYPNLRVKTNGDFIMVNLTIRRVTFRPKSHELAPLDAPLYLVVLEQAPKTDPLPAKKLSDETAADLSSDARIATLQQELHAKEEYLQTTNEELETSNEELKSTNEEMQSVNEELQSTNEELETSKEELQSVNEELATVNAELQTKVADLSRTNNDMNNLLAGTGIATVFVDHNLRIMRFTPTANRIINLIQSDIGRPVGHIVSNLEGYATLSEDIYAVLDTLVPTEVEVQTRDGVWYSMRIQPYRTLDNVIEGAVLTFVDISAVKNAREALREVLIKTTLAVVDIVDVPLILLDNDMRVVSANSAFLSTFQLSLENTIGQSFYDLSSRQWDIPSLRRLLESVQSQPGAVNDYELRHNFNGIGWRTLRINIRSIFSEASQFEFILLIVKDISDCAVQPPGDFLENEMPPKKDGGGQ